MFLAFGPGRGRAWSLDFDSGELRPLFAVGFHRTLLWDGQRIAVLQQDALLVTEVETAGGLRLPLPQRAGWDVGVAMAGNRVALSWPHPDRPGVRRIDLLELERR